MKTILNITAAMLTLLAGQVAADAARQPGENKVAMCIGCHGIAGYRNAYPEVYSVPMIGGQNKTYLIAALRAYKKGERKHGSMQGIAGGLSEKDMDDVASYYASR